MGRDERHAEQSRAAQRARREAVKRLIAAHKVEWQAYYAEAAQAEGVKPNWSAHLYGEPRPEWP